MPRAPRKPFSWRAEFKRLLIRRVLLVALYVALWQVPALKEWRLEQYARMEPLVAEAVSRIRAREVTQAPAQNTPDCARPERVSRGQDGSIQFHRPGGC